MSNFALSLDEYLANPRERGVHPNSNSASSQSTDWMGYKSNFNSPNGYPPNDPLQGTLTDQSFIHGVPLTGDLSQSYLNMILASSGGSKNSYSSDLFGQPLSAPSHTDRPLPPPPLWVNGILQPFMYECGTKIFANYMGKGRYYRGRIDAINNDDTYDVTYDHGVTERNVLACFIRTHDVTYGDSANQQGSNLLFPLSQANSDPPMNDQVNVCLVT